MTCKAKTSSGRPCRAPAIQGGTVCSVHGGRAPQVVAAARLRILLAADPAAAKLVAIALGRKTKHTDAIVAIRELLNRAGLHSAVDTGINDPGDGSVLWDEFIQIHRRRVAPEIEGAPE